MSPKRQDRAGDAPSESTNNPVDDELALRKPREGAAPLGSEPEARPPPEAPQGRLTRRDAHPSSSGWASDDQA